MGDGIDIGRYRTSMARLEEILRGISETASSVSTWRCPYKNAHDQCTANFGCRNQSHPPSVDDIPICLGSDHLDYRSAWET